MPGRLRKNLSRLPYKPTREEIASAAGQTVPDVIAPSLRVLFCGINPGLYTAAVGHHFARPGNRFWPALHQSGFTARLLSPFDEIELLEMGLGITNVVEMDWWDSHDFHSDSKRGWQVYAASRQ